MAFCYTACPHTPTLANVLPQSDLVKVYVGPDAPPKEVSRIRNIGRKAHGLVAWGKRGELIALDSDNGLLVSLDPDTGDEVELWQVTICVNFTLRAQCEVIAQLQHFFLAESAEAFS